MAVSSGVMPPARAPGSAPGAEQQAHILHPVAADGLGQREVQAGGHADQHIGGGTGHAESLAELGTD